MFRGVKGNFFGRRPLRSSLRLGEELMMAELAFGKTVYHGQHI